MYRNHYDTGSSALKWCENQFRIFLSPGLAEGNPVTIVNVGHPPPSVTLINELITSPLDSRNHTNLYLASNGTHGYLRSTLSIDSAKIFLIGGAVPNSAFYIADELHRSMRWSNTTPIKIIYQKEVNATARTTLHTYQPPPMSQIVQWFEQVSINSLLPICCENEHGIERTTVATVDGSGLSPEKVIASGGDDDANALGEVLHRSTKTCKSKKKNKKCDQLLLPDQVYHPDSDVEQSMQLSSTERSVIYRSECLCETHYDKQLVERNYDLTADKLFDLTFGTNEFVRTYRQAQRFYDDTATEWTMNEETHCRERVLNYKMPFESTLVGKGIISTREKQALTHEAPGSHYILETEVSNEGVKFSDTFSLSIRYCLVQTSVTTTNLRVTAQVRFSKPINGIVKQLIERNAYSASQEGLKDLNNRLNLINNFKIEKSRLSRGEITLNVPPVPIERGRRMSRHDALALTSSTQSLSDIDKSISNLQQSSISSHSDKVIYYFIFMIGLLVIFHLYLYIKLKHMDVLVDNLSHLIKIASSISSAKH